MALDTQTEALVTVQSFSATRAQVRQRFTYSVATNGRPFTDNESFTEFANPASFTTDPWTVLFEAGPHPLFDAGFEPLCAYLASE